MNWPTEIFYLGYLALFGGCIVAMLAWHRQQRKQRLPFTADLKLLRAPGETQLRLVRRFEEEGFIGMIVASVVPAASGMSLLLLTVRLPQELQLGGAALTLVVFLATFYYSARWFSRRAQESGNRYLGYFGERVVAEQLEPLKAHGWRIFHDVPGGTTEHRFNLDHLAVGPAGVFVIETKTRRKGPARPGFDSGTVYFDGGSLVWPWGEDNHGLEQAERHADWFTATIKAEIAEQLTVTPVLALPGWVVALKPSQNSRRCRVANPQDLSSQLLSGPVALTEAQISRISAKLEARCRDVEY